MQKKLKRKKYYYNRIGANNSYWKGGIIYPRGYKFILMPEHPNAIKLGRSKYMAEHRLVVEKQIGRYLHSWEITHHINKIKDDNRPENLMAFNNHGAHRNSDKGKEVKPKYIIFDGRKL